MKAVPMTAIVGLVHKGKVWMGSDSAGVAGLSLQIRRDPKLFASGEFVIGYTSSFRMGQLLRFYLKPERSQENQDGFEYMVRVFIPAVREVAREHGFLKVDNGREELGTFLVGRRGTLYLVQNDLQVAELATPYAACGCGNDLALGAMYATESLKMAPRKRIETALKAAEAFSAGVRGPFTIVSR